MNILSPQLLWINGRCYRINPTIDNCTDVPVEAHAEYIEEDLYGEENDDDYDIELIDGNRFKTTFHVPRLFFALLIGAKGTTKKRLESETKTQIKIPQMGVDGNIDIIGNTRKTVCTARRRIEIMILAARSKQQNTHFLCVPIVNQEIKLLFIKFKNDILQDKSNYGLSSSLFQNSDKLHLTIGTLSLMDNEDRAQAANLLQDCQELIIKPILQQYGEINIKMNGIEYMNDDPSEIDILYGKVESEPLQIIVDQIVDYFIAKGLMQKQYDRIKLHVTLMNSLFRNDESSVTNSDSNENECQQKRRETFDARNILQKYVNYYFGTQKLTEIHLSLRYSQACDGFYEATGILKI